MISAKFSSSFSQHKTSDLQLKFSLCLFTGSLNYYSHLSSRDRGERVTWDVFPHREFHLCIIGDYNTLAVSLIIPNILLNIQYKQLQSSSCSGHLFMIGYLKLSNEDRISNKKILFRSILWLDHQNTIPKDLWKTFFYVERRKRCCPLCTPRYTVTTIEVLGSR